MRVTPRSDKQLIQSVYQRVRAKRPIAPIRKTKEAEFVNGEQQPSSA